MRSLIALVAVRLAAASDDTVANPLDGPDCQLVMGGADRHRANAPAGWPQTSPCREATIASPQSQEESVLRPKPTRPVPDRKRRHARSGDEEFVFSIRLRGRLVPAYSRRGRVHLEVLGALCASGGAEALVQGQHIARRGIILQRFSQARRRGFGAGSATLARTLREKHGLRVPE